MSIFALQLWVILFYNKHALSNAQLKQEIVDSFNQSNNKNRHKHKRSNALPFQKKFHKKLFLETGDAPTLADVYVWPECQVLPENSVELQIISARSAVDSFIEQNDNGLLIIEGVAGSGKSSLMCALSTIYDNEDCYFLSMKDLIDRSDKVHRTDFKNKLWQHFGLNGSDYEKILFLDGYDELHSHLDELVFRDELQSLIDLDYKIIMTTRPGYLDKDFMPEECQMIKLWLFSDDQIRQWLERYRTYHNDLDEETVAALLKNTDEQKFDEIRRIPIMLYVIANRNIRVDTVSCMGELYERVFDGLKNDKAGETKQTIERHYEIAQKMAYHMSLENELRADANTVREWCGEIFEETFFASVYIENSIIEGTEVLDFVHKTILEFFAAKWIYKCLWEDELTVQEMLAEANITYEILTYIQFFYRKNTNLQEIFDKKINHSFAYLLENGISINLPKMNLKLIQQTISKIFINLGMIIKNVINQHLFNENLVKSHQLELDQLLNFCYRGQYIVTGFDIQLLTDEDFTGIDQIVGLDWAFQNLANTIFQGILFNRTTLWHANFNNSYIRDVKFVSCNIENTSFDKAELDQVTFDAASLINAGFIGAKINDIRLPKETAVSNIQFDWTEIANSQFLMPELNSCGFDDASIENTTFSNMRMYKTTFDHAKLKNVTFEKVNFVQCDFTCAKIDENCRFIDCRFTKTKNENGDVFTGNSSQWCQSLSDKKC